MASSLNKVQLIGNATKAPEVREIGKEGDTKKVANFTIATNKSWKDKTGKVMEEAEFTPVVLWRQLAEVAESYITKGKQVFIEGSLKTRSWDDENGVKRYVTEVIADKLILLGDKGNKEKEFNADGTEEPKAVNKAPTPAKKTVAKEDIEDIPF